MRMSARTTLVVAAVAMSGLSITYAQTQKSPAAKTPGQQKALKNYEQICQPCHGPGGKSPMPTMSLVDAEWKQGSSTAQIAKTIAEGIPGTAMMPNKDKFTKEEILELARLVRTFDPRLKPEK
jgi:mono/diheme cytochrome c family protein